ncbi:MAG: hypothetical protein Q4A68_09435 [Anaerobiospirillum succiniciproducens]|uniref:hypothetical protein n=1 Tax=Anaerobiospirillum succiniciproducens TaxID=13335 RepID=UPI0026DC28D4|nr:hypothetical protein [Anaerobiospirillum succiniciproducens]MDO4676765.1 hypothetical protein [Anaerobiospirillum succiniciproducens]
MLTHSLESTTESSLASSSVDIGCKAQTQTQSNLSSTNSPKYVDSTLSHAAASKLMDNQTGQIFHQACNTASYVPVVPMQRPVAVPTPCEDLSQDKQATRGFFGAIKAKATSWFKKAFRLNGKHKAVSSDTCEAIEGHGFKSIQSNCAAANHAAVISCTSSHAAVDHNAPARSSDAAVDAYRGAVEASNGAIDASKGAVAASDRFSDVVLSESMAEAKEYIRRVRNSDIWHACGGAELMELSNNVALYRPEYGKGASVSQPPQGMGNIATPYGIVRTITGQQYVAPIVSLPIVYGKTGDVVTQRMIRPLSVNYTGRYRQFPVIPVNEIAGLVQGKIDVLKRLLASDASAETVALYLDPLLTAMIRICSVLPASEYYHDCNVCGLVDHNLKVAIFALTEFKRLDPQPLAAIPTTTLRRRGVDWIKSSKPSAADADTSADSSSFADEDSALSQAFKEEAEELESPASDDEIALSADASKLMSFKRDVRSRALIKRDIWLHTNEDTFYRSQAVADVAVRMRIDVEENPLLPSANAKKKAAATPDTKPIPTDGLTIEQIMASGVGKTLEPSDDLTPPSSLMSVVDTLIAEGLDAEDSDIITDESIQSDVVVTGESPYKDWTGEEDFELGQKKATQTDAQALAAEQKAKLAAIKKQLIASLDSDPHDEEGLLALCRRNLRIKRDLNLINSADLGYFSSKRYLPALDDVFTHEAIELSNTEAENASTADSASVSSITSKVEPETAAKTVNAEPMSEQSANADEAAVETKATKAVPKKAAKSKKASAKKAAVAECANDADATPKALVDTSSSVQSAAETAVNANEDPANAEPESTANAEPASNAMAIADTEQTNSTVDDEVKPTTRRRSKTTASKKTTDSKSTETKATNKKATTSKTKTSSKRASKKQAKEADAESINTATAAAAATSATMDQAESSVTSEAKFSANDTVGTNSKKDEVNDIEESAEATANATVVKRKRGRKPKASISTATESKAKTETVTVPENVTKDSPVSVPVSEVKANAEDKPKAKRGRKPKSDTQNKISADEMAKDTAALDSDSSDESKSAKPKSPFKKPYRRPKKVFANMSLEQMAQITPIDSVNKPSYDESIKPFIPAIVWADSL